MKLRFEVDPPSFHAVSVFRGYKYIGYIRTDAKPHYWRTGFPMHADELKQIVEYMENLTEAVK